MSTNTKYDIHIECDVLAEHQKRFDDLFSKTQDRIGRDGDFSSYLSAFVQMPNIDVFDKNWNQIISNHSIGDEFTEQTRSFLEKSSLLYLGALSLKPVAKFYSDQFSKLQKLEQKALKFREDLEKFEPVYSSLDILSLEISGPEAFSIPENRSELINRMLSDLEEFQKTSAMLTSNKLAQIFKLGTSGPKGNPENSLWVHSLRMLWEGVLIRNLKHDKSNHGGRESFLCFAEDCFSELYPNAAEGLIRNTFALIERDERTQVI